MVKIAQFKAGSWQEGYQYRYFLPEKINRQFILADAEIEGALEKAAMKLADLNALARFVPNVNLFITTHALKEAVKSSRIEGTQTEMQEALLDRQEVDPEHRDDWEEVHNYVQAMDFAIEKLTSLPLSNRLLKEAHNILLTGVRGRHKLPGEFRSSQNWIGGATLKSAFFVPPAHIHIPELMSDLEQFLHNDLIHTPHLIKIAIAHYQFETIHPFLDGNGRLGRLLITLYLISSNILAKPLLYLSDFFEKHRTLYYDNLTRVREKNDLRQWILFFLIGIEETAIKATRTFEKIILLQKATENNILALGKRAKNAQKLLEYLFSHPLLNSSKQIEKMFDLTPKATNDLIASLEKIGVLKEITGYRRNRIFVFKEYLDLFNDSTES